MFKDESGEIVGKTMDEIMNGRKECLLSRVVDRVSTKKHVQNFPIQAMNSVSFNSKEIEILKRSGKNAEKAFQTVVDACEEANKHMQEFGRTCLSIKIRGDKNETYSGKIKRTV